MTDIAAAGRRRRSALYLPASNPRAIAKARTLAADVVILDLEDAVAPERKAEARAAAVAAVREGGFGERELVVRANALDTPWGEGDLTALAAARPAGVLMPKVSGADDIAAARDRLRGVPVWAMIETARAVLRLEEVAAADGLAALVMGTNDLAKEMRARPGADRLSLVGFLSTAVAAGRAYGRAVLDGVYNAIDDADGFAREAAQGAMLGFDGKTLIHPAQIDACNRAFRASADELAWARTVRDAFADPANAGRGAIRLGGQMVERLHLDTALAMLARAEG